MEAKICYFYGISPAEYRDLGVDQRGYFWECITIIEAQQMLNQMTVAMLPKLKDGERRKLHKEIHKLAHPSLFDKPKNYVTAEDVQRRLSSIGNKR